MPEVIMCVLWSFSLIVIRECIQGAAILTLISGDNANYMWVRAHNDPGVVCGDASPFTVSDYAQDKVGPMIEVEP